MTWSHSHCPQAPLLCWLQQWDAFPASVINLAIGDKVTGCQNNRSGSNLEGCWTLGRAGVMGVCSAGLSRASCIDHYEFTNARGMYDISGEWKLCCTLTGVEAFLFARSD